MTKRVKSDLYKSLRILKKKSNSKQNNKDVDVQ